MIGRDASAFFAEEPQVRALHLSVLAASYALAFAFYPFVARGLSTGPYFAETYFGCLGASLALSLLALLFRPGMGLLCALGLRCYLFLVLGYSIGSYLSVKLALSVGLVVEACLLVGWPGNVAFASAQIAAVLAAQLWPGYFGPSGLASGVRPPEADELASLAFVLALAAAASILDSRQAARQRELADLNRIQEANLDALAELNQNLQGYARTVDEQAAERERNRISREIHDISGYIFTNLIALMDAAGSMPRDEQAGLTDLLIAARNQAQEGLRETRAALRKLRAEKPLGMADSSRSIYKIVSIFRAIAGIEVKLDLGNMPRFLAPELNLALYRTVQEALTNAIRHGKARHVRVGFWVESGTLGLTIADDGKGASEVVKGIGLTGMEERIGALGGKVETGNAAGGGFWLHIEVPLRTAEGPPPGAAPPAASV